MPCTGGAGKSGFAVSVRRPGAARTGSAIDFAQGLWEGKTHMAQRALSFQSDPAGLAASVEKLLAAEPVQPAWEEDGGPAHAPLWRRAWGGGMRLLLGRKGWERRRVAKQIRRLVADSAKPVLAYVVPFDVWKLRTGGGQRIAGIAKALSRNYNVLVLTSAWSVRKFAWHELGPDCRLLAVPTGAGFMEQVRAGQGAGLFAFADHFDLLADFRWMLDKVSKVARAWGLVHPIAWPVIQPYLRSEDPVFYDAHDDYAQFLQHAFGNADARLVARLVEMEQAVLKRVAAAVFCTGDDLVAVRGRNPACPARMMVVPNGVDASVCQAVWPSQTRQRRRSIGLDRPLAVFMGSIHKPNREAAGHAAAGANLVWTGPISENGKEAVFSLADMALAPLKSGTGSSLKIPDYIAHGKIVVATPVGLRGGEELARFASVISTLDVRGTMAEVLRRLEDQPEAYDSACRQAREWVERTLEWSVAAKPLVEALGGAARD